MQDSFSYLKHCVQLVNFVGGP
eukprot:COSAG02_NODE_9174_length_2301_cov_7.955495_4_plen_21_part_01